MPWVTDINGDRMYKLSIYAKEELPTWSEVYDLFYTQKQFVFDPNGPEASELDLYWKIQKRKYLLAIVCNQFNKMLFEDGMKKDLMTFIHNEIRDDCIDVRFTCEPIDDYELPEDLSTIQEDYERFVTRWKKAIDDKFVGTAMPPPIYTFPLPTGESNPFLISKHPRVDINTIHTKMCLVPILKFGRQGNDYSIAAPLPYEEWNEDDYNKIIDFMMRPFKEYFEGAGIGWKDKDGNLLEVDPLKRSCDGAGYDPAL